MADIRQGVRLRAVFLIGPSGKRRQELPARIPARPEPGDAPRVCEAAIGERTLERD